MSAKLKNYARHKFKINDNMPIESEEREQKKIKDYELFLDLYAKRMIEILTIHDENYSNDSNGSTSSSSSSNRSSSNSSNNDNDSSMYGKKYLDKFHKNNKILMSLLFLEYYILYETIPKIKNGDYIHKYLIKNAPRETIEVYRGQEKEEIRRSTWFSCSTNSRVASDFASRAEDGEGHIFKIHVENVPVIDVNRILTENSDKYLTQLTKFESENEYIVLGGGTFYQDKNKTIEGYSNTRAFYDKECWYTAPPITHAKRSTKKNGGKKLKNTIRRRRL